MAEADHTSFTLATYNIHVGVPMGKAIGVHVSTSADLDNLTAALAETSADIVALQEVDCEYGLSFPARRRSSLLNQARYLAASSGLRYYVFGSAQDDTGYPTDNAGYVEWGHVDQWSSNGMPHGDVGNALLSRWPLAAPPENIPLPKDSGQERRACIRAEIQMPGSDGRSTSTVVIYATHLQHNNGATRYKQMQAIVRRAAEEPDDRHVFILGDLNHELDDAETSNPIRLAIDSGYQDLAAPLQGEDSGATNTFPADAPDRRIDFILSRKPVRAWNQKVIKSPASDHLPVAATVELVNLD